MARHDHPTADALYTLIREEYPNISLGTVYRNLNLLVELGEIQKLTCGDGADRFDADTSPHYHFVCKHCGKVSDLPLAPMDNINHMAQEHADGTVDSHTIYFYGICKDCFENNSR
jgi:Fur family peroxide stress response transcriptional regulator